MSQMSSYLFEDDFEDMPEFKHARVKVNRLRYQQVREALKLNKKYNIRSQSQIAEDFGVSPRTVNRIKNAKSYNKYLNRNKRNERPDGNVH